jgi:hypothetical protein
MCYYSLSLRRGQFRSAKQGEDLVVSHFEGHGIVRAQSDGMIACVAGGTIMVQIPEFRLTKAAEQNFCLSYPWMREAIGKPVTGRFTEGNGSDASDHIMIGFASGNRPVQLHLSYFPLGTILYTGPKRPEPVDIADTLGVNDPSIVHDHNTDAPKLSLIERARDLIKS